MKLGFLMLKCFLLSILILLPSTSNASEEDFSHYTSDLEGEWILHGFDRGEDSEWFYGELTSDENGNFTFSSFLNSLGVTIPPEGGTFAITSEGILTNTSEPEFHGIMTQLKDMIFFTSGNSTLGVIQKKQGVFTLSDLEGTWRFHGSSGNNWFLGEFVCDSDGNFTFTSFLDDEGNTTPPMSETFSISSDGIVISTLNATFHGVMNHMKDIVVFTSDESTFGILQKKQGTFTLSDLEGTWKLHGASSGGWFWLEYNSDSSGNVTFTSFLNSDGDTHPPSPMTFSISSDGLITNPSDPTFNGSMNQLRDIIVFTADNSTLGFIRGNIKSKFTEKNILDSTTDESIRVNLASLSGGTITGDLNGSIDFSEVQIVTIETGSFAGKGFLKGDFQVHLEGNTLQGEWRSVTFDESDGKKIHLKGSVFGDISATVEGTLIEAVPGSGIYNQMESFWTVTDSTIAAIIQVKGLFEYYSEVRFPETEIQTIQTQLQGTLAGGYVGYLNTVFTQVRIVDSDMPCYGEGFSFISYEANNGSGEIWTYDRLASPSVIEMTGMSTTPLFGFVNGLLDERVSPRNLFLNISRVGAGQLPTPNLRIKLWSPKRVSSGENVDYIIAYGNDGLKSAENVKIVYDLPMLTDFVSASSGYVYDAELHQISWNLGTLPPKANGYLYVRATVFWALPPHFLLDSVAYIDQYIDEAQVQVRTLSSLEETLSPSDWVGLLCYALPLGSGDICAPFVAMTPEQAYAIMEARAVSQLKQADYNAEILAIRGDYENSRQWTVIANYWQKALTAIRKGKAGENISGLIDELGTLKSTLPSPPYPDTLQRARHVNEVIQAHDPNIKYGPEGNVSAGQLLYYRVEYENEGEGNAFGVYFTDKLDEDLDASTLKIGPVRSTSDDSIIAPEGVYDPITRTITWFVGEVGSGVGGYADLSVNVRDNAEIGTEIINFATVYFPSVPEATLTNGIVSLISPKDNEPPMIDVSVNPVVLWPPNGKMTEVTIYGNAFDRSGIASISFEVIDEYDKVEPLISGFGSIIKLESWRRDDDFDGRYYVIIVNAKDLSGNESTSSVRVLCPHDMRK